MATRQRDTRGVVIGVQELEKLRARFAHMRGSLSSSTWLAEKIGDQQANSARRRIRETKTSPDGRRWKRWSKKYAKTRKPSQSLLVASGDLADSMTHVVRSPSEVEVGSNLDYAGAHLYGTDTIPARPYLDTEPGFADSRDREELRDIVREFLRQELKL